TASVQTEYYAEPVDEIFRLHRSRGIEPRLSPKAFTDFTSDRFSRGSAGLSGEIPRVLFPRPRTGVTTKKSPCPGLTRASTSLPGPISQQKKTWVAGSSPATGYLWLLCNLPAQP